MEDDGLREEGPNEKQAAALKRDLEKPKRPPPAFMFFLSEVRAAHPELTMCEHSKQASVKWKAMSMQQKELYKKRVEQAAALKRDREKPKRPPPAFMIFLSEIRAAHPELTMCEHSKQASARWKAMSMQQKEPYSKRAEKQWQAYMDAMGKYKVGSAGEHRAH